MRTVFYYSDNYKKYTTITGVFGHKINPPKEPTKKGYRFIGWYCGGSINGYYNSYEKWDFSKNIIQSEELEIFAEWSIKNFTVKFDTRGIVKIPSKTLKYNKYLAQPNVLVKKGKILYEWYKDKKYKVKWNWNKDKVTDNITLYGKWRKACTVTYVSNNNKNIQKSWTYAKNDKLDKSQKNLIWYKHDFLGWFKNKDCTKKWNFKKDRIKKNIKLYAGWKAEPKPAPSSKSKSVNWHFIFIIPYR